VSLLERRACTRSSSLRGRRNVSDPHGPARKKKTKQKKTKTAPRPSRGRVRQCATGNRCSRCGCNRRRLEEWEPHEKIERVVPLRPPEEVERRNSRFSATIAEGTGAMSRGASNRREFWQSPRSPRTPHRGKANQNANTYIAPGDLPGVLTRLKASSSGAGRAAVSGPSPPGRVFPATTGRNMPGMQRGQSGSCLVRPPPVSTLKANSGGKPEGLLPQVVFSGNAFDCL